MGNWPAGPAWFIWLLLAFDVVAAVLFAFAPAVMAGSQLPRQDIQPSNRSLCLIVALSAVAYIPLVFRVGPDRWSSFGPFTFQTSRLLHYFVYFLVAVAVGATASSRGSSRPTASSRRRWPLWVSAMFLCYFVVVATFLAMLSGEGPGCTGRSCWHPVGSFLRGIVLRIHVSLRPLCHPPSGRLRQPYRQRLRHVPHSLRLRELAAVRSAPGVAVPASSKECWSLWARSS